MAQPASVLGDHSCLLTSLCTSLSWPVLRPVSCEDSSVASQSAECEVRVRVTADSRMCRDTERGWGLYTGTQRYIAQEEESFNRLRKQTFLCSVIYTERQESQDNPKAAAQLSSGSHYVRICDSHNLKQSEYCQESTPNTQSRTVVTKFDPCVDKNVQSSLWQAWTARRSCGVPVGSPVFPNYLLHLSDLP